MTSRRPIVPRALARPSTTTTTPSSAAAADDDAGRPEPDPAAPIPAEPAPASPRTWSARPRRTASARPASRPDRTSPTRPERRPRAPRPVAAEAAPRPPRTITVRTLVLSLVLLVAFIVLAPTLRAYLTQSEQRRAVEAEYAATSARVEELQRELGRWQDPAFIQAQARERLAFVMPGEVPYRVIDPQTVPSEDGEDEPDLTGLEAAVKPGPQVPWYLTVWDSVVESGVPESESDGIRIPSGAVQP